MPSVIHFRFMTTRGEGGTMKHSMLLCLLAVSGCAGMQYGPEFQENADSVAGAVGAIKTALSLVDDDLEHAGLSLSSAVLTLNTSYSDLQESKGKVFILGGTGVRGMGQTNKIQVTLVGAQPRIGTNAEQFDSVDERLAAAIASTIDGISGADGGAVPLFPKEIVIEQALTIHSKETSTGELEVEVLPVSFGMTGTKARAQGHTLKISLVPRGAVPGYSALPGGQ